VGHLGPRNKLISLGDWRHRITKNQPVQCLYNSAFQQFIFQTQRWLHEEYHDLQCLCLARADHQNHPYRFTTHQREAYIRALASQQYQLQTQERDQHYSLFTSPPVCSSQQPLLAAPERYLSKRRTPRMPMPSNSSPIILYSPRRCHRHS